MMGIENDGKVMRSFLWRCTLGFRETPGEYAIALGTLVGVAAYLSTGLMRLFTLDPADLRFRWIEIRYVLNGIDPFAVLRGDVPVDPNIGRVSWWGGYAPWSYLLALPVVPPVPFRLVRIHYAALNVLVLVLAGVKAFRAGKRLHSLANAFLLAGACLCLYPMVLALRWGNYGLVVLGCLVGMAYFDERRFQVAAGLCLAMAMIKPQLGGLFALVLLVRGSWVALLVAAITVGIAWGAVSLMTEVGPVQLLREIASVAIVEGRGYYYGLVDGLIDAGANRAPLLLAQGAIVALSCAWILWRRRHHPIWRLMAVPAVLSTMWTYQCVYDAVILYFLLLALGESALRKGTLLAWTLFLIVGVSIWQPTGVSHGIIWPIPLAFRLVWCIGLAALFCDRAAPQIVRQPRVAAVASPSRGAV